MKRRLRQFRSSAWAPRVRWAGLVVAGLVVLGIAWVVVTGFMARSQLEALQQRLVTVRVLLSEGKLTEARQAAQQIPDMTDRADRLTSGPAWWAAAQVPYVGDPVEVARGATGAADQLGAHAVPDLLSAAAQVDPAKLRVDGDTVRLGLLARATPALHRAGQSIDAALAQLQGLPTHTWLGALDSGRAKLATQVQAVSGYVDAANRAAVVVPELFGADGRTRRFFVGLQNDAEARGTGGLPGAFAIARTQNGKLTFERFESDAALLPAVKNNLIDTGLNFGSSYDSLYGAGRPTQEFNDSNASPHFPYAARIWAAMWQKEYHQHIDGAVTLDPTTLSYFLATTGPATISGGRGTVSAANVVSLVQRDEYTLYPDNAERRAFLVALLKAAANKLTSGAGSAVSLVADASRAAAERRFLVWSEIPSAQRLLEQTTYAGDISGTRRPLSAVILNNAAAGKLDFYVHRSIDYSRTGCGSSRDIDVTITLRNDAPASGLPPYVTTRLDQDVPKNAQPGDTRSLLDYYATGGALLQSVSVNGQRTTATTVNTLGRTVFRLDLELPRGQTQTIQLHLSEPAGTGDPELWLQPGVNPISLNYQNQPCD